MADEDKPVVPLSYRDTTHCFQKGLVMGNQVAQLIRVLDARDARPDISFGTSFRNRANTEWQFVDFKKDVAPVDKAYEDLVSTMVERIVKMVDPENVTTAICFGFEDTERFKRFAGRVMKLKEEVDQGSTRELRRALEIVLDGGEI